MEAAREADKMEYTSGGSISIESRRKSAGVRFDQQSNKSQIPVVDVLVRAHWWKFDVQLKIETVTAGYVAFKLTRDRIFKLVVAPPLRSGVDASLTKTHKAARFSKCCQPR